MISLLSLSAQFSASFMPAVIFSMPCKYSSGHSTPVSVGRDLSLTHRWNIPGKFANHQVVGKAGVSHAEHGIWWKGTQALRLWWICLGKGSSDWGTPVAYHWACTAAKSYVKTGKFKALNCVYREIQYVIWAVFAPYKLLFCSSSSIN